MTTLGHNDIINNWSYDIYVAYSALAPHPKEPLASLVVADIYHGYQLARSARDIPDVWKVARISPGMEMDSIDADYIRAADKDTSIVYRARRPITVETVFTARCPEWIKIRQFSTIRINQDETDPKIGVLSHISNLGSPAKALDEAAKYDSGWRANAPGPLGNKQGRGTDAVKAAIEEWEEIIAANQLSGDTHKKHWYMR